MWPFNCNNRLILRKLDTIIQILDTIRGKEVIIMATMADLILQVKANTDVGASAILLIQGMAAKIQALIDAGADPVALQAAVDELTASATALGDAVKANTPAA